MMQTRDQRNRSVTIDMLPGVKRLSSKEFMAMPREERMAYHVEFKLPKLGSRRFGYFELTPRRETDRTYSRIGRILG
ncbi:hypothetical protein FHR95_002288 [Halomonas fontilapidosi]|uniref:Uncharacterized protein n=1 Tax=Halomonas fontilapidosi TaxID=616675 RepID=A0A7W5GZM9_9GAMM|nr:hypothetical protein [Halomonas fontilapidosi]MBB3184714.1 hypothetical protein [Halomonas fontilapidosi]